MVDYRRLAELVAAGEQAALCTIVRSSGSTPRRAGSKMLVFPDGKMEGTIGGGEMESRVVEVAVRVIGSSKPEMLNYSFIDPARGDPGICGGQMEIYVEAVNPQAKIIVYGAGHVGRALAELAHWLGFRVVLADDRENYITGDDLPPANEYLHVEAKDLVTSSAIHAQTAVVLTTRSIDLDVGSIPALLETEAMYLGVIGSRRRWQTTATKLVESGVGEEELGRVVSPIGLEIEAESPQEIALSVMAEILMLSRGGDGSQMGVRENEAVKSLGSEDE